MIIDFCIFLIPVPSLLDTACSLCGADTQSPNFRPSDHGENLCGRGTISCPLCAKTFSLWSHYEAHKKCHQKLKQRQYPCATCGKVSANPLYRTLFRRLYTLRWVSNVEHFIYRRSSLRPAIETCTREFTRVFDRFIVRPAEYSFGKKLTCKSIRKPKAISKLQKYMRKRSATDSCHPTRTPASVRPLRKRTHGTSTG